MTCRDPLAAFCEAHFRARTEQERMAAIRSLRAAQPQPPADPDPERLREAITTLLVAGRRDGRETRLAAASLLRDLWWELSPPPRARLFHPVTLLLLEQYPARDGDERRFLWDAIERGFATVDPAAAGRLCEELVGREVSRSLGAPPAPGTWRGAASPPPNFRVLRLVVRNAPTGAWSRLVRDLWRLFNLDLKRAESLARGASLAMSPARCRAEVRRSADGSGERVALYWDLARQMLHRTLHESQPGDVGDAAPDLFTWLEGLAELPEAELSPFLLPLAAWASPATLPVLEHWSRAPHSALFRRRATQAARRLRTFLGRGSEVVPVQHGFEPTPAVSNRMDRIDRIKDSNDKESQNAASGSDSDDH